MVRARSFDTAFACSEADLEELAALHYKKLIPIDPSHSSALNNLGVAFSRLKIQNLAVAKYKRAVANDETLAASNLANIFINDGMLEEAEKLLKEAQTKKDVHENVSDSLVKLETAKREGEEDREKCLNLANAQYRFLTGFSEAIFAVDQIKFPLDGKWNDMDGEIISTKMESANAIEMIWSEQENGKFRFHGNINGLASKGKVEQWREPLGYAALLLQGKPEGKLEPDGIGYVFLSKDINSISIFVQKSDNHRSLSFNKAHHNCPVKVFLATISAR
jgi:tetratricopeptide (TPR) repeat protein